MDFASLFQVANGLQTFLDQYLKPDQLTGKQFLLMIEIGSLGPEGGLLTEVAKRSESSHQNVKQIALKLQKNGYITMEKDQQDKRATRLKLTPKALSYWQERFSEDINMLNTLFMNISTEHLSIIGNDLLQIKGNLNKWDMSANDKIRWRFHSMDHRTKQQKGQSTDITNILSEENTSSDYMMTSEVGTSIKTVQRLGIIIVILATVASGISLLKPDIYNDNAFVSAVW